MNYILKATLNIYIPRKIVTFNYIAHYVFIKKKKKTLLFNHIVSDYHA